MVYLLSAGESQPEYSLSAQELVGLGAPDGVTQRARALGVEGIRTQVSPDCLGAHPSELAPRVEGDTQFHAARDMTVRALTGACERIGVAVESLGVVVGESTTPIETTPSEAQRVAGVLGQKIPAFDISSGFGPLPGHLDYLAGSVGRLEHERPIGVSIGVHLSSQRVDYATSLDGGVLGDGAAALLFGASPRGSTSFLVSAWEVRPLFRAPDDQIGDMISVDVIKPIQSDLFALHTCLLDQGGELLAAFCQDHGIGGDGTAFIGPQVSVESNQALGERCGVSSDAVVQWGCSRGYALGASVPAAFAASWEFLQTYREVVTMSASVGGGIGLARFVREES